MSVMVNAFKGTLGKVQVSGGGMMSRLSSRWGLVSALNKMGGAGAEGLLGDMGNFAARRIGSHAAIGAGIGAGLNMGQHLMFGDEYGNRSGRGAFRAAVKGGMLGATLGAGVGAGRMAFGENNGYRDMLAARAKRVPQIAHVGPDGIKQAGRDYQQMIHDVLSETRAPRPSGPAPPSGPTQRAAINRRYLTGNPSGPPGFMRSAAAQRAPYGPMMHSAMSGGSRRPGFMR
jgi:hypothetical protein